MTMRKLLLTVVMVLTSFTSYAETVYTYTAEALVEGFKSTERLEAENYTNLNHDLIMSSMVQGYVLAVKDSLIATDFLCNKRVSIKQALAVVEKYVKNNPDEWDRPVVEVSIKAFAEAFPCKKE